MFLVYKFTFPNNKIYIGYTANFNKRWSGYVSKVLKSNDQTLVHRAMRKYGLDSIKKEFIYICNNQNEALEAEKKFIAEYGCMAPRGYNCTMGGECFSTNIPWNKGRKYTQEELIRFYNCAPNKKSVFLYNIETNSDQYFDSIASVSRFLNVHKSIIKLAIKNNYFVSKIYLIRLSTEKLKIPEIKKNKCNKRIKISNGLESRTFTSLKDAATFLNISTFKLTKLYNGKSYNGWSRVNE